HSNTRMSDVYLTQAETDSRYILDPESALFFALKGSQKDGHEFIPELIQKGVRVFVVTHAPKSQSDEQCFLVVDDVLRALQRLASYHRSRFLIPVIGITGSNGKTIVKEWLYAILQESFQVCKSPKSYNSQLGVALSVLELREDHEIALFEAGISRSGEMSYLRDMIQPTIGLITNIGDAHQSGFSGGDEKTREKLLLFDGAQKVIYCKDYPSIDYYRKHHLNNVSWSQKLDADYVVESLTKKSGGLHMILRNAERSYGFRMRFEDEASLENATHCIVAALELGLTEEQIQKGLDQLHNLSMRLEQKEGINGCILINDSYSLDLKSLQLALQFVDQQNQTLPRTLVLSDFAGQTHTSERWSMVSYLLTKYQVHKLIAVGQDIRQLKDHLPSDIQFHAFESTAELIEGWNSLYIRNELILIKGARTFRLEQLFHELSLSNHDTILEIDLKSITHNLNVYRSVVGEKVKVMAVVKAAAYGSGHYEVARLLEHRQVDYLAVAYPDEGILLRQKGIQLPIMVMNAGTADFGMMKEHRLEPEIFAMSQLQRLVAETGRREAYPIHLKLDTGMHRLGFQEDEVEELIRFLKEQPQLQVRSIFSHLSGSDQEAFVAFTREQAERFSRMAESLCGELDEKPLLHLLNSGGVSRHPDLHFDMIRLGIGMYGIDSDPIMAGKLEKAHTLKTRITQVKDCAAGETVSYNRSGLLKTASRIGVLSIGYADGLPRMAGVKAYPMWLNRSYVPLVGVVCMDLCMVDLTGVEHVREGMEVEVFGKHAPVERLAALVDTIPYEILSGISDRVKRIFLQD
ncbi:MAG TPA: bifunctional UDP-N-acetylmuramoyl-tripeptide:D-alanyl-D-alanine ligase/alanine racemase, partial [Saprospiraceae bacterium]|nr:bifunctional UDP-N-acetylmuramoyl-tripeptide:D-alanyl-D-alanine ligase/alanine racemase [Saprospiraceae bacterium]